MCGLAMCESGDEVRSSNDLVWVEKSESECWLIETNTWVSLVPNTRGEICIATKPPHVKEWDMSYIWEKRPWSTMANVDMENADYAAIPKWMRFVSICLMRKCHKVGVSSWIERVLMSATIVGSVVDSENLVAVQMMAHNRQRLQFFIRETLVFSREWTVKESCQNVRLKTRNKVLENVWNLKY
jgi:hypothetical protein